MTINKRWFGTPEELALAFATALWSIAEHTFKLLSWALAGGLLIAILRVSNATDPKIIWIVYGLIILWGGAFFAVCIKLGVGAQDFVFKKSARAPKWISLLLIIAVTFAAFAAVRAVAPIVMATLNAVLTTTRLR